MHSHHRYTSVRKGGRALAGLAPVVQFGSAALGVTYFLSQAQTLLSDAQFTRSERWITALIALTTVVGFGLVGWVLGTVFRAAAGLLDLLADEAEASWRVIDLMEMHVIPTLGRLAVKLDGEVEPTGSPSVQPTRPAASDQAESLKAALQAARDQEDVDQALELRDELTQHLRDESLRSLDQGLAEWVKRMVEKRIRAKTIDWEVARWTSRAIESLGDEPALASLHSALPEIRRRAGLCTVCGLAVAGGKNVCGRCQSDAVGNESTNRKSSEGKNRR